MNALIFWANHNFREFFMKTSNIFKVLLFSISTLAVSPIFANTSNTPVDAVTDTAITAHIKAKIAMDKNISNSQVAVTTNNAVVALTGTVDSDSQASNVIALAESSPGVKDVDASNLKVKESKQPYSDTAITGKVKGLYLKEKLFSDKDVAAMTIHVETKNGVVYLTGTADNEAQAKNAIKLARSTKGVTRVESTVKVQ
jgi:hyperosmotically inducible protein